MLYMKLSQLEKHLMVVKYYTVVYTTRKISMTNTAVRDL